MSAPDIAPLARRKAHLGQAVVVTDREANVLAAGHLRAWGSQLLRLDTADGYREYAVVAVRVWTRRG